MDVKKRWGLMALFLVTATVNAAIVDGSKLAEWYTAWHQVADSRGEGDAEAKAKAGLYMGYIQGATDGLMNNVTTGKVVCLEGRTVPQLARVIGKWLDAHPEQWQESGTYVVLTAITEAFPCKTR